MTVCRHHSRPPAGKGRAILLRGNGVFAVRDRVAWGGPPCAGAAGAGYAWETVAARFSSEDSRSSCGTAGKKTFLSTSLSVTALQS